MALVSYIKDDWMEVVYEPGDIVRLISGSSPQRVEQIRMRGDQQYLVTRYCSGLHYRDHLGRAMCNLPRIASDFVLLQSGPLGISSDRSKEKETMPKLYQTKSDPAEFGSYLATNSKGELVLEMKGTGDVRPYKPSDVEIVVPYTIGLTVLSHGGGKTGPALQFAVPKGSLKKGDLIFKSGAFYIVSQLDTKAENAHPLRGAQVMAMQPLTEVDPGDDEEQEE